MTVLLLVTAVLFAAQAGDVPAQELDLAGWVALAYHNSPAVSSADASLLSSQASLAGSRSFLWPTLSMSAGVSKSWSSVSLPGGEIRNSESNSYSTGLSLSQELLQSGGQNWLNMQASELTLQAAEADYEGDILNVTMDVINAYYAVLEAVELKKAAEAAHDRSESQLQRTEALYGIGGVTTLELLQVQVQESSDKLAVSRKDQSLFAAYSSLCNASGVNPSEELSHPVIKLDAVLEPLPMESVQRIPLDYSRNPGLAAASLRAQAAELQATAAGRGYWPSLRASAGWNWNDDTLDNIDRMFDNDRYNVGLHLSWNIFDGFIRESRINSARASDLTSRAALETLQNRVRTSVESLDNSLKIDIQYYSDSKLMLEQAQEQYRLSLMSYEMGALSLMNLLDAQSDLAQSEANLVSAKVTALKTEASLMVQLGIMPRVGE